MPPKCLRLRERGDNVGGMDAVTRPDSRITVRRAEPADFEAVRAIFAMPQAQAQTLQLPLPSSELWEARMQSRDPDMHLLVAELDGEVVAQLGLHVGTNPRRRHVADIGMGVRDDHAGRGIGSALLQAALSLADDWLQVQRIELQVYADNAAAIALYRRHGFIEEGRHARYAWRDGEFVDAISMARLSPPG